MTDPYRACLAELLSKIDYTWGDIPADVRDLMDRARALLAQPVAEGPTAHQEALSKTTSRSSSKAIVPPRRSFALTVKVSTTEAN
jgi:hypothetical protein